MKSSPKRCTASRLSHVQRGAKGRKMGDMWRAGVCAGVAVTSLLLGGFGVAMSAIDGDPTSRTGFRLQRQAAL